MRVGIVGAGPAGSFLAERLSAGGLEVMIFDHTMPREKPCGGGLSLRATRAFPFLSEVAEKVAITRMRVMSPGDKEVVLHSSDPMYIFSRNTLDSWLLRRALERGASFMNERVVEVDRAGDGWTLRTPTRVYGVDLLVGADGARSMVRPLVGRKLGRSDYRLAVGGYVQGLESDEVFLKFMRDLHGYFWVMPRVGHVAVGLGAELGSARARCLFSRLDECLRRYVNCEPARCVRRFVALIPCPRSVEAFLPHRVWGNAALVGDAAMLVDPISGEGIFYALKSASLLATALLDGALGEYDSLLEVELSPAIRAAALRYSSFFDPRYLNLLTTLARRSSIVRDVVGAIAFGRRGYEFLPAL